jgi:hypothetical protein
MTFWIGARSDDEFINGATMNSELLEAIERRVGKTAEEIRRTPIDEMRSEVEKKLGTRLTFKVRWPLIGRGNILRDRVLTNEAVERLLDAALK